MKKLLGIVVLGLLWSSNVYALPQCEGSNHNKWTDCFRSVEYQDGVTYDGEWRKGLFHGKGTLTLPDGNNVYGGWKHGKLEWQADFDRSKVLSGVWTIKQPIEKFLQETDHNFTEEEIYIYKHWIGFVKADHICQILGTEKEFISNKHSRKFGVKGQSFVILLTNCKSKKGKFGLDNLFITNKGSLVLFQYSSNFEKQFTFSINTLVPNRYKDAFYREEVKFVKIDKISDEMNDKKFLNKFKHKFKDLN